MRVGVYYLPWICFPHSVRYQEKRNRTPFLGRLLRVDLITLVGLKCPSVHPTSIRPREVSLISMKFGM